MYNDKKKVSKQIIRTLIIVFFVFLNIKPVQAETSCSTAEIKKLKQEAAKINFIYNLVEEYNSDDIYKYNMNFVNFTENFYIVDSEERQFIYSRDYTAETIFGSYLAGTKVTFKVYGAYGTICQDKLIRTVKIAFPYYNPYSRYEECKGIEEFKLCKRNYNGKIESEKWFLERVKEYKESQNQKPEEPEKKKNFLEIIIKFINENPIIIFALIAIIIIVIVLFVIRYFKNRNNIKIDLNIKDLKE